jgi:cell wall-associated NlpC family hydrolase
MIKYRNIFFLIFAFAISLSSCTKRAYISNEVIYSVDDDSEVTGTNVIGKPNSITSKSTSEAFLIDSMVNFAESCVGAPYKYGGTTPNGFDCSGFVQYVFSNFNIKIPRIPADMVNMAEKIDYKDIKAGDLVYFKGSDINSNDIGHVAFVIEKTQNGFKMIHATSTGVVINDYPQYEYWTSRYLFATRFKKEIINTR